MPRGLDYQKERSERQITRILEALKAGPLTSAQLADSVHLGKSRVHAYLHLLRAEPRRVRIAGYLRNGGQPFRLFALGAEPDEPLTQQERNRRKGPGPGPEPHLQRMTEELTGKPMTVRELAAKLRASPSYVREYLNMLRKQKRAYISRWILPNERGGTAPVFAAGKRKDAERPKFDRAEYERRVKANPVKLEARRASRRKQEMLRQARAKPQNPFSALGL